MAFTTISSCWENAINRMGSEQPRSYFGSIFLCSMKVAGVMLVVNEGRGVDP